MCCSWQSLLQNCQRPLLMDAVVWRFAELTTTLLYYTEIIGVLINGNRNRTVLLVGWGGAILLFPLFC